MPPLVARRVSKVVSPELGRPADGSTFEARSQTGSIFLGRTTDQLALRFGLLGYHDWRLWVAAIALCAPDDTIVEVGANIGTETVGFSDIVGRHGRVVAFEPVPASVSDLQRCTSRCRHSNVEVFPFAVGDRQHLVHLDVPTQARDRARVIGDQEASRSGVSVECVTLDSLSGALGRPRMIFIDVEGYEVRVIRGARSLLSLHSPDLVVEANPDCLQVFGFSLEELRDELAGLGYSIAAIGRLGLHEPSTDTFPGYQNWLCVRGCLTFWHCATG